MPTTATINSTYAGEVAGQIIGGAFKEADTISKNLITVLPNIAVKQTIRKIDYGNGRQDYTCKPVPSGSVSLSEVVLEPKKIINFHELCKEDFRNVWDTASMGFSAHNDNMPKDEEDALVVEILADTAQATDSDIWVGDATDAGHFDGLLPKMLLDATVVKVALPVAITEANVVAKLKEAIALIPTALLRKSMTVVVSPDVATKYQFASINASFTNGNGAGEQALQFGRYTLNVVNGLPDNTIVIYETKNLYFGTGLMADHNELVIKDMSDTDLTDIVKYKMCYTAGTTYVRGAEIVLYTTFV